jgi:hypothetical protein
MLSLFPVFRTLDSRFPQGSFRKSASGGMGQRPTEVIRVGRSFRVPEEAAVSYLRGAAFTLEGSGEASLVSARQRMGAGERIRTADRPLTRSIALSAVQTCENGSH